MVLRRGMQVPTPTQTHTHPPTPTPNPPRLLTAATPHLPYPPHTYPPTNPPRPGPQVLERVKAGGVLEAFLWRASRFHDKVLREIPLYVVTNDKIGLLGARAQAIRLAKQVAQEG